jgi:hypothetical protein
MKALSKPHLRDIRQRMEGGACRLTKLAALALQAGGVKVSVFVLFFVPVKLVNFGLTCSALISFLSREASA